MLNLKFEDMNDVYCFDYAESSPCSLPLSDFESKKKVWTKNEDDRLLELVSIYGAKAWTLISKLIPGRTGKQCHNRWSYCLNPTHIKGNWTPEEDQAILEFVKLNGTKWSMVYK